MSVDVGAINKKLCNIDNKKSQGYDNIPGKLLRLAHSDLAPHLMYFVNECFRTSAIPNNMKNTEHDNLESTMCVFKICVINIRTYFSMAQSEA